MVREIRKYEVFKLSHQLTLKVYPLTKKFPVDERFGLVSQMRRSAYSIPMNLIEGGARDSQAQFRQFVDISKGSCAEIQYQLELVRDLKYISVQDFNALNDEYNIVGKMLTKLMNRLKENR